MTTVPQLQPLHQRQQQQQQQQQQHDDQHRQQQHNQCYQQAPPPEQQCSYSQLDAATYDPDEAVPRDSPIMKPLRPRLEPSLSPPPDIPPHRVSSFSPPPANGRAKSNQQKVHPVSGDAVLVAALGDYRDPEIAREAAIRCLPGGDDDDEHCYNQAYLDGPLYSSSSSVQDPLRRAEGKDALPRTQDPIITTSDLQTVAAGALQAVDAEPNRHHLLHSHACDISTSTRHLSISDERPPTLDSHSQNLIPGSPVKSTVIRSPSSSLLTPAGGGLPPLMKIELPQSESNGTQSLPPLRITLREFDRDLPTRHGGHSQAFPCSPPAGIHRLPPMSTGNHVSPPMSPEEEHQRSLPSPHSLPASSPYNKYPTNGLHRRPCVEYSSNTHGDTPSTDRTTSTSVTTSSVAERMSIDGITNPQVGAYACTFPDCNAAPFQTQYLLNSHANVHSSARPHYCPVPGCPRSEGGKGFKRKNEMIRHGLVHDSPGYVCPFCADREHKYPRPDNLQRHVRAHHTDKNKDDPQLRNVLAQRRDGPNRGRRRRVAPQ